LNKGAYTGFTNNKDDACIGITQDNLMEIVKQATI
jgi:hypothetical protein